ncbi:Uncharacterised protein [Klebsiella pneumoniae]|nr:Uncharacterised protein [Klebsiella pneumoniae]
MYGLFFRMWHPLGGMRTPDQGSTTGNASWTDRARSKRAAPQGRAKRVNPPSPPYFKKSSYACTGFFFACGTRRGDENPRPGFDNWRSQLDRLRACERAAPTKTPGAFLNNACVGPAGARPRDGPSNGERSESIPPSPPYFKKSSYACTGFFFACGTADIPGVGSNASPGLPDRTRQVARLSAAPPGGYPKTTKPGLARALLTV